MIKLCNTFGTYKKALSFRELWDLTKKKKKRRKEKGMFHLG